MPLIKPFKLINYGKCRYKRFLNNRYFSSLHVWGSGSYGELGLGQLTETSSPVKVPLPSDCEVRDLSFGAMHSALVSKDGRVFVTGSNLHNQLGLGADAADHYNTFTPVPGLSRIKQVSCGDKHTLALAEDGTIYSWGYVGNFFSVNALGRSDKDASPGKVELDKQFAQISAGSVHSVGLTKEGEVYTWGNGDFGSLGTLVTWSMWRDGTRMPTRVEYLQNTKIDSVEACSNFTTALTADGKLFMWGRNDKNQLGLENINIDIQSCENVPVHIKFDYERNDFRVKKIGLSNFRCVAITPNDQFYEWGQVFVWPTVRETALPKLKQVGVGNRYQMALTTDGRVFLWGSSRKGLPFGRTMSPRLLDTFGSSKVSRIFCGEDRLGVLLD